MIQLSDHQLRFRPLVALVGPTAAGKSDVGVVLAQMLGTEVLTADSRQVYRGMNVATDKPTAAQQQGIPHRLIDLVDPDQRFNAGLYRAAALQEMERLYVERKVPLIVGGTGLYVRALVKGLCDAPQGSPEVRENLIEQARRHGKGALYQELCAADPVLARGIHPNDEAKIIRALEVVRLTGRPLSEMHQEHRTVGSSCSPLLVGLQRDRASLYRRIEQRVNQFFARGLVEETAGLLARGYHRELASMKGLGYRQVSAFLAGECDYDEAVRRLKRDTRHFAKRQLTWFRREPGLIWLTVGEDEQAEDVARRIWPLIETFLTGLQASSKEDGVTDPVGTRKVGRG